MSENILFDKNATQNSQIQKEVIEFLKKVETLEKKQKIPIVIFQDAVNQSYYIKCNISAAAAYNIVDINARLKPENPKSFRANRELLLNHTTYGKMKSDAAKGREFNDIIVEYNLNYTRNKMLKVWGG